MQHDRGSRVPEETGRQNSKSDENDERHSKPSKRDSWAIPSPAKPSDGQQCNLASSYASAPNAIL